MCGILLIVFKGSQKLISKSDIHYEFKENICRRGPDSTDSINFTTANNISLLFTSSVLWLQGKCLSHQPVQNDNSIFVYNGDIFKGVPEEIRYQEGDTKHFFNILNESEHIHDALGQLEGPYAFIFFDKLKNKIYFGRDRFGRRSLLIGKNENTVILTSVAKRTKIFEFMELPSLGTFSWDLTSNNFELYPYYKNQYFTDKLKELETFLQQTFTIKSAQLISDLGFKEPSLFIINLFNSIQNLTVEDGFSVLLKDFDWLARVTQLENFLTDAVRRRISSQPKFCKLCIHNKLSCQHSLVGILFSGGVDCSILALLSNKFVDERQPIDLFNVAFDESNNYITPDRLTGLETLEELKSLCPNRIWRFHEINISNRELDDNRSEHIADLIYPLRSILDDSLGCALWFASRGLNDSVCRVLLVGMGADELFGGYTKHRAAFKRESWLGLHNILNEDWHNLPYRNLARDDRVVSDHGRQLRTPYLDENVVNFVRGLQCWEKSCPSDKLVHGFGDKILLRSVAYRLGLRKAASLKKKALQFGSKIANKKEVANEVSSRLC